jgi:GTP1/Obg family GTP-binding protein
MGFQLQLRHDIKAGKREMTYRVIDKGDYDTDRFAVIDEETLNNSGENLATVKAEKVRDSDSKRKTLMWFATDKDYLMVRLLQVEPDGSEYELTVDEAQFKP